MQIDFHTRFVDEPRAIVKKGRYHDGSIALVVDSEFGEPLTKATVCLSGYGEHPADGNVFIKDYSENEGVLAALSGAGVIGKVIREVPCGFEKAYEVPLLATDLEEM